MNKKMFIIISIGILICTIFGLNVFCNSVNNETNQKLTAKDKLQVEDFIIGGLYVDQPIDEVIKILGKPKKIQRIPDGFHGCDEFDYYFPGIIVIISELNKSVFQINIKNKDFRTFRGIAVGDNEEDVYYHYGKTKKFNNKILSYQMYENYEASDSQYILNFHIQNNKVSEIVIYKYYPD